MNDITFTDQEKVSEMGLKMREYLESRIRVLHKKLENQKIDLPDIRGIQITIEETRKFLAKFEIKP